MTRSDYLNAVAEFLYGGEVLGEAVFASYLGQEPDPTLRFKWATLMQFETETKARLRPFLTRLGLDVAQPDVSETLAPFAAAYAAKSWDQHMEELAAITGFYLGKFAEIESAAPESEREMAHAMVLHETALGEFARRELAGETAASLDPLIAQLTWPLAPPSSSGTPAI